MKRFNAFSYWALSKIRAFGSSTFPASRSVEAQWAARERGLERFVCEDDGPGAAALRRPREQDLFR